jgi:hypothetical protein
VVRAEIQSLRATVVLWLAKLVSPFARTEICSGHGPSADLYVFGSNEPSVYKLVCTS